MIQRNLSKSEVVTPSLESGETESPDPGGNRGNGTAEWIGSVCLTYFFYKTIKRKDLT